MTIITVYALYFDDIRILFFPKSMDDIFYGITLFGMIAFLAEIIIASYAKDGYIFSFFFWLDIISTVTMIPDCGWIWDPIIGGGGDGSDSATDLAKTSRAGRVTRVIRVIRLIRLIRIVKLYKQSQLAKQKANEFRTRSQSKLNVRADSKQQAAQKIHPMDNSASRHDDDINKDDQKAVETTNTKNGNSLVIDENYEESSDDEAENAIPAESKISKTLSDQTTKTVVLIVLLLLFMLAGCSIETYVSTTMMHEQGIKNVVNLYNLGEPYFNEYKQACLHFEKITRDQEYPLIFVSIPDPFAKTYTKEIYVQEWEPKINDLRADAYSAIFQEADNGAEFVVAYSTITYTKIESTINIIRTSFICVVLSLASIYFTKDAQVLVLDPLERMIEKVKLIAKNPLAAATDEVHEAGVMSFMSQKENKVIDEKQRKEAQ